MRFKGILEFGCSPTPAYLAQSISNVQAAPIDGTLIYLTNNSEVTLPARIWSGTAITSDDLRYSRTLMERANAAGWGKCIYNFALVQLGANSPLWADGESVETALNNLLLIFNFCSDLGLYGVFFDLEGYDGRIWQYASQNQDLSFAETKARIYSVFRRLASAWQRDFRNLKIMTSVSYDGYANRGAPFELNEWGLSPQLLNALIDEAGSRDAQGALHESPFGLILSTETMYGEKDPSHLLRYGYNQISGNYDAFAPPIDPAYRGNSAYFGKLTAYALSLWIDYPAFNPATPSSNYFTPAAFASQIGAVIDLCDFGWVYQNSYKFFNSANLIPQAYIDALNIVRAQKGLPT